MRSEAKLSVAILTDWKKRFIASYDVELQEWINSVASGQLSGPSSWDGYAAAVYVLSRGELEDAVDMVQHLRNLKSTKSLYENASRGQWRLTSVGLDAVENIKKE